MSAVLTPGLFHSQGPSPASLHKARQAGPQVRPMAMAFTDLLDTLGSMGRFQLIHTALLLLPCGLLACHNFLQNFTATVHPHHCRGPANHTEASINDSGAWLRATVPLDQLGAPEPCWRFTKPQWALLSPNSSGPDAATEGCKDGWVYNHSVFPSTIVMETEALTSSLRWDLVCEARTLRDLEQSVYMAGVLVGAAVFGSLADRLGCKAPLVWSYLQLAASGAATAYFSSFSAYCIFRFLMGMTFSGIILNSLSLVASRVIPLAPPAWQVPVSCTESAEGGCNEWEEGGRGKADQGGGELLHPERVCKCPHLQLNLGPLPNPGHPQSHVLSHGDLRGRQRSSGSGERGGSCEPESRKGYLPAVAPPAWAGLSSTFLFPRRRNRS
ncbi:PREDICTED: solute carrier family 22 member 20 [Colobus angolensis palliatus]|uniref:solute carrier family 22 member 20 n=1 Tax=Colobus angolensis palliatus TaxID=336983 RepID=UPI0005F3A4AE|nr:PREDICTED: solute carrier family 22 member 20 [Colobus angolensis palliatus]